MIVRATVADAVAVEALLNEYYREIDVRHRETPEGVRSYLNDSDAGFWIAYVEGAAAGCVALRPVRGIERAGECKRLFVRAPFRRQGIAEALIDAMEAFAKEADLEWIYLDSKDDLEVAIALYRRRGYEDCERYNDNSQATVFLRKQANAAA